MERSDITQIGFKATIIFAISSAETKEVFGGDYCKRVLVREADFSQYPYKDVICERFKPLVEAYYANDLSIPLSVIGKTITVTDFLYRPSLDGLSTFAFEITYYVVDKQKEPTCEK